MFLVEETGERLGCLLNPQDVVQRRVAGLQARRSSSGRLGGPGLSDDPLLHTGGGRTELELKLLFDVSLTGSTLPSDDVRRYTEPLWRLAENVTEPNRRPPQVRFIWGKAWNVPGMVAAVAERLEAFSPGGAPRRSWLHLRLVRTAPSQPTELTTALPSEGTWIPDQLLPAPPGSVRVHQVVGGGAEQPGTVERLDAIAAQHYGDPSLWRLIAKFNDLDDPASLRPGQPLQIPPLSVLGRPG
jgi:hypothetical protein